ncbi:MAG: HEAT repeat domain-containing protein [Pyrinomonadaceae bacterium]|nr:HEAT repeat domain-containing protein [Pyrinomonadaceae bacterium]
MAFAIDSNWVVDFAWILGIACTLASVSMILFVLWFRRYVDAENRHEKLVNDRWQETLFEIVSADESPDAENLPDDDFGAESYSGKFKNDFDDEVLQQIPEKDSPYFLYTWNYIHESLRGNAKDRLNAFAKSRGAKEKALKLLRSRFIKHRLLALNTLGNLGEKSTYDRISTFAAKRDPIVSVWAFRAMFRIRPRETLEKHLHLIAERADWSPAHVAKILKECDVDLISEGLAKLCNEYREKEISEKQFAYLVSYLRFAHQRDAEPILRKLISESSQMEVLISCLRLVRSEDSLPSIRKLLIDERWQLRMFSIMAIERFGHSYDIELLKRSLDDKNWWVRYYAAQALLRMPDMTTDDVKKLSVMVETDFERDILLQVLAEAEFRCKTQSSTAL